jgi:hypothetical protein
LIVCDIFGEEFAIPLYNCDVFLVENNATFSEANCERVGIRVLYLQKQ